MPPQVPSSGLTTVTAQSIFTSCTTIIESYQTTISATRGQTVYLPAPSTSTTTTSTTTTAPTISTTFVPTTVWDPTSYTTQFSQPIVTSTTTATEIDVYVQTAGFVYSTFTIPISPTATLAPDSANNNGFVYVLGSPPDTHCANPGPQPWSCWSKGGKVGLIVGVVLAAALLLFAFLWLLKSRNEWIAHDWRWARAVEGNVVPTLQVNGPLDRSLATPYGYGGGYGQHPGWGWGR